jgi:3-hydroxyacyl-CoA dehydrogenase/enoyl-CoA hydratase/3-hydroxybutyryl-CoA epimerase
MTLSRKVREETRAATGDTTVTPADTVIDRMVLAFERGGRAAGAGFYEYADGKRTRLWPGLLEAFGGEPHKVPFVDAQERMLFAEALETARCFDEGVLTSVADANVGSILGIGFPAWTGGVAQYVEQYEGGVAGFVARADQLADAYGERFRPPTSLRERAAGTTSNAA